jgi:hypothetical protein
MRKFLITAAAAVSALSLAAPASAQWTAPVYHYQPYNYGYGFNGHRFARSMEVRVQRIRGDIRNMEMRRVVSPREARTLDNEARLVERRIFNASRNGINNREARNLEIRIQRLERHVMREASDWNNRPGRYRH